MSGQARLGTGKPTVLQPGIHRWITAYLSPDGLGAVRAAYMDFPGGKYLEIPGLTVIVNEPGGKPSLWAMQQAVSDALVRACAMAL